jgi:cbb3-type cytochrome oxidase subunit 3
MIDFLKDNFINILVVVLLLLLLILINIYIYKPENKKLIKKVDLKYKYY